MYIYHIESPTHIYIGQASEDIPSPLQTSDSLAKVEKFRLWEHFTNAVKVINDTALPIFMKASLNKITISIFPAAQFYGLSKEVFDAFLSTFVPSQLMPSKVKYSSEVKDLINEAKDIRNQIYRALENNNTNLTSSLTSVYNTKEQEVIQAMKDQIINNINSSFEALDIAEILHILYYAKNGKKILLNKSIGGQYTLEWKLVNDPTATRALTRWRTSPQEALQIIATLEKPGRKINELNAIVRNIFRDIVQDADLIDKIFNLDTMTVKGNGIHLGLSKQQKENIVKQMKEKFVDIINKNYLLNEDYKVTFSKESLPKINDLLFTVDSLEKFLKATREKVAKNFISVTEWTREALKKLKEELVNQWKTKVFFHWKFADFLKVVPKTNVQQKTGSLYLKPYNNSTAIDKTSEIKIFAIIVFSFFYTEVKKQKNQTPEFYINTLVEGDKIGVDKNVGFIKLFYPHTIQQGVHAKYLQTKLYKSSKFLNSEWNKSYHIMLRLMNDKYWEKKEPTTLDATYDKELHAELKAKDAYTYAVQNYSIKANPIDKTNKKIPNNLYPYYKIPTARWNTYSFKGVSLDQLIDY